MEGVLSMGEERVPTILVVEDEEELASTFDRWLQPNYRVITAHTATAAIDAMNESVEVVLLDRRLPDRPGEEVLDAIRSAGYDCRVAMITAVDPDVDILDMAFDDYVVKPVTQDELLEIVDGLLTLSTYDEQVQRSFGLATKIAVLESEKPAKELQDNEEYRARCRELEQLRERINETLAEFESDAFTIAYRDLSRSDRDT